MKLNEKVVLALALPPESARLNRKDNRRVRDVLITGRPGLIMRVAEARGRTVKTWRWRYWADKKPKILTLGTFPALSVRAVGLLYEELRSIVDNGGDPGKHLEIRKLERLPEATRPKSSGPTVNDVAEDFINVLRRRRKRPEAARQLLETNVLPLIGELPAVEVRKRDLVRVTDAILERGSKTTANRVHSLLKQMFSVAVDRDLIETAPGFPRERPGGNEKPRTRVLTDDEIVRLWRGLDELTPPGKRGKGISRPLALAIKLLLVTAQRRGEIATARWDDVVEIDLVDTTGKRQRRKAWRIPETKNDEPHLVPLSPLALSLLEELRAYSRDSEYWLPNSVDHQTGAGDRDRTITKAARRLRDHLTLDADWTPHDLRRTARTGMASLGVSDTVAERVLNHVAGDRMVAVYNRHAYSAEMSNALDRWADHLTELTK
jgi:integrase